MANTGSTVDTSEPLPQSVESLAAAQGLGPLRATFLPKRLGAGRLAAFFFTVLMGLFVFVLPGLYFIWRLLQFPNFSRKQAARRLYLFEQGLIVSESAGPTGCVRWDRVTMRQEIIRRTTYGIHVGTTHLYTLINPDGSTVQVTEFFADPEVWGQAIQTEVTRTQLPAVLSMLEQGQTVFFADIAVNTAGVSTPKTGSAAWSEIVKVSVISGFVYLRKAGERKAKLSRSVESIPNFPVFMAAVEHLRAAQVPA